MKKLALSLVCLALSAAAQSNELALCAKIGKLKTTRGDALLFKTHVVPALWGNYRVVDFQVCDVQGRPRAERFDLEMIVEPLTPRYGEQSINSSAVTTDGQGRFHGVYGAGRRLEGSPWTSGLPSRELHHYRLGGRIIATFLLEIDASEVRYTRQ
jgi:hypothetical protein